MLTVLVTSSPFEVCSVYLPGAKMEELIPSFSYRCGSAVAREIHFIGFQKH